MMSDVERPSFILHLVAKFSIVMFPLSLLVNAILIKLGLTEDWSTLAIATVLSFYISEWYEELNNEVYLYVLGKAAERENAKDPGNDPS
jgi:hypothetical protein